MKITLEISKMTFEEEAALYEQEAVAVFAKEEGNDETSAVNNILRRGVRVIRMAQEIISDLRDREEAELLKRDGFELVKNVQVSKQLAVHLRPYRGCPRGPMGLPWDASPIKLLRDAKDFLMRGQDETFVCVPRLWYEPCVEALEKMQEAARIEPPTLCDLTETEDVGHGQAGAVTSP